ncbi:MAG: 50S ribosomal protein L30 [Candidatus Midichloria sp.]|nr:MAG: 50S ribosomal protein L30 [Candidatus Midichloria sp.]
MAEKKVTKVEGEKTIKEKVARPAEKVLTKFSPEKDSVPKEEVAIRKKVAPAGCNKSQIATLKGLNLNKASKVAEQDTSAVRGMIEKVKHLLRILK